MLPAVEAHEALVAGVLGIASLHAYGRRRDPIDRTLALVALWICVTGIAGLLLAQLGDPWRYVRLALRLTGPVLLLVVAEESVRTADYGGTRRNSLIFAGLLWGLALGGVIYRQGRALVDISLEPVGYPLNMGVTAWMALVAISAVGALLSVAPAAFRRIKPGLGGIAATVLLASELWAAVDPRWGTGALGPVSYRTLLTLGLALLAFLKARSMGFELAMSSAAAEASVPARSGADRGDEPADEPGTERSSREPPRTSPGKPSKSSKKRGKR